MAGRHRRGRARACAQPETDDQMMEFHIPDMHDALVTIGTRAVRDAVDAEAERVYAAVVLKALQQSGDASMLVDGMTVDGLIAAAEELVEKGVI